MARLNDRRRKAPDESTTETRPLPSIEELKARRSAIDAFVGDEATDLPEPEPERIPEPPKAAVEDSVSAPAMRRMQYPWTDPALANVKTQLNASIPKRASVMFDWVCFHTKRKKNETLGALVEEWSIAELKKLGMYDE